MHQNAVLCGNGLKIYFENIVEKGKLAGNQTFFLLKQYVLHKFQFSTSHDYILSSIILTRVIFLLSQTSRNKCQRIHFYINPVETEENTVEKGENVTFG